ncbi:MAG: hypothetical protein ACOC22_02870 [bacterium]
MTNVSVEKINNSNVKDISEVKEGKFFVYNNRLLIKTGERAGKNFRGCEFINIFGNVLIPSKVNITWKE